jgi:AbrB family looped-hinge helix DNA binding protein
LPKISSFYYNLLKKESIKLYKLLIYKDIMSVQENEVLVKITSAGTISIPKQFRKYMDIQKGEYIKVILGKDRIIIRKITII